MYGLIIFEEPLEVLALDWVSLSVVSKKKKKKIAMQIYHGDLSIYPSIPSVIGFYKITNLLTKYIWGSVRRFLWAVFNQTSIFSLTLIWHISCQSNLVQCRWEWGFVRGEELLTPSPNPPPVPQTFPILSHISLKDRKTATHSGVRNPLTPADCNNLLSTFFNS